MDSRRCALLIGSWDYENAQLRKLISPGHDVRGLNEVLVNPQIGGFDQVQVLENMSELKIRRSLTTFFSDRPREDLLLLYFSGHGIKDAHGRFYLAAVDTDPKDLLGREFRRVSSTMSCGIRRFRASSCCSKP